MVQKPSGLPACTSISPIAFRIRTLLSFKVTLESRDNQGSWSFVQLPCSLLFKEIIGLDVGFLQDCPERAFGDVARMVLDGGVSIGFFVVPDLKASGSLPVKGKPKGLKPFMTCL